MLSLCEKFVSVNGCDYLYGPRLISYPQGAIIVSHPCVPYKTTQPCIPGQDVPVSLSAINGGAG